MYKQMTKRTAWLQAILLLIGFTGTGAAHAFAFGPTTPGKWGGAAQGSSGGTVTWSLMSTGTSGCSPLFGGASCSVESLDDFIDPSNFSGSYQDEISRAFSAWSNVADITFQMVADNGVDMGDNAANADIRIGGVSNFDGPGNSSTLGMAIFPPDTGGTSYSGDILLDETESFQENFGGPGVSLFQVLTHLIGHALGLDDVNDPAALMNSAYTEAFEGPQADDIAGIQTLYGAAAVTPAPSIPLPTSVALMLCGLLLLRRRSY